MMVTGHKHFPLLLVVIMGLLAILLVANFYGDLLGIRLIKQGSPRLGVSQGEKVTLELADSEHLRKLELCVEKKNLSLGYSDFSNCRALNYNVGPHVRSADVTIPNNFPIGRAVVITRLRGAGGKLLPQSPTDEKIALLIAAARATTITTSIEENLNGGGGDGGGSSSGDSSGSGSSSQSSTPSSPLKITSTINSLCIDVNDREVHTNWNDPTVISQHRQAGESNWRSSQSSAYTNFGDGIRTALLFNSYSVPSYSYPDGDYLSSGDDFEIQLHPGAGHSEPDAEPSEVYRFTVPDLSGAAFDDCVRVYP